VRGAVETEDLKVNAQVFNFPGREKTNERGYESVTGRLVALTGAPVFIDSSPVCYR
jgi:hypothetical protein